MSEYIAFFFDDYYDGNPVKFDGFKELIVRCKDCKWFESMKLDLCMLPDGDSGYACWEVEPDGFCKWGERA